MSRQISDKSPTNLRQIYTRDRDRDRVRERYRDRERDT